ncbi:MAG: hypothetical protein H7832_02455 [Magnetococcus sp. DMHC-6]
MPSPKVLTLLFVQAFVNHPHLNVVVPCIGYCYESSFRAGGRLNGYD